MPKKGKPSFLAEVWNFIMGALWYFLVTLVPAAIAIIEFFGGDNSVITGFPWWVWSIAAFVLVIIAIFIALQRHRNKLENESKKRLRNRGKSLQSNATNGGQAVSIGGNNFAPIVQEIGSKQIRPDLTKLTEIRERGYLLRNKGLHLEDERLLSSWLEDFESWNTEMLQALGELDKDKARVLKVLGNIQRGAMYYPRVFGEVHALKLDVFNEKLARLDKFIDDYMKLPLVQDKKLETSSVINTHQTVYDVKELEWVPVIYDHLNDYGQYIATFAAIRINGIDCHNLEAQLISIIRQRSGKSEKLDMNKLNPTLDNLRCVSGEKACFLHVVEEHSWASEFVFRNRRKSPPLEQGDYEIEILVRKPGIPEIKIVRKLRVRKPQHSYSKHKTGLDWL